MREGNTLARGSFPVKFVQPCMEGKLQVGTHARSCFRSRKNEGEFLIKLTHLRRAGADLDYCQISGFAIEEYRGDFRDTIVMIVPWCKTDGGRVKGMPIASVFLRP